MVLITIVTGAYKPTYNWGASHGYNPIYHHISPIEMYKRFLDFLKSSTRFHSSQNSIRSNDSPIYPHVTDDSLSILVDIIIYTQIMSRILIVKYFYGDHIHWSQDSKPGDFFFSFYVCPEQTCFKKRARQFH